MKTFKTNILLLTVGAMVLLSCTDRFSKINTNDVGLGPDVVAGSPIVTIQRFLPIIENALPYDQGDWQLGIDLAGSSWIGYTGTPNSFGGANNTTYTLLNDWNGRTWSQSYGKVMSNWKELKEKYRSNADLKRYYAMATVVKVFAMQRITDTYGPIIYSDFGSTQNKVNYDPQSKVYDLMFADLDESLKLLNESKGEEIKPTLDGFDYTTYAGDLDSWIKFSNSLRLRLAMRIVKADPAKAKTQAEKAVAGGVIEAPISNAVAASPNYKNLGLYVISNNWSDTRAGAVLTSYLKGYKDPRLTKYFEPVKDFTIDPTYEGKVLGVRGAISISAKSDREGFSKIGATVVQTNKMVWITAAEVYFLRAEGALRGWNMGGGVAKTYYESGVTASFSQYGFDASIYLADSTSKQSPYVDPVDSKNNSKPADLSTITIAWNDADVVEKKLERIITQKYLAMFPNGAEAWSEWRRTGYPIVFPAISNTSAGKVSTEKGVRRINFTREENQNNADGVKDAIQYLKNESDEVVGIDGGDVGGTRVWWDKTKPNF